jgi:hypothetical protein
MSTADWDWSALTTGSTAIGPAVRVWILAVVTYGVGDGLTTAAVVWSTPLLREANPIVNAAVDAFGAGGLIGLKILALGTAYAFSVWGSTDGDQFMFYLPPVVLAVVGTATTLFNLHLLL